MNYLTDPNFELGTGWEYTGGASRTTVPPPFNGTHSGRLYSRRSNALGDVASAIYEENIFAVPGVPLPFKFRFNLDGIPELGSPPPNPSPGFPGVIVYFDPGDGGGYQEMSTELAFSKGQWGPGWNEGTLDLPLPVGPSLALKFALSPPGVEAEGFALIDAVELGDEEAHLMRSTALDFMNRLKALVEGIDPNIGKVYVTTKRWPNVARLEDEGTLRIKVDGIFDDATRVGRDVTRFWFMRLKIDCEPLTNGSAQYTSEIELGGFYQHEDGDAQIAALNMAAIEILDRLNTHEAELTDLATGPGYLGYLLARPRMSAVQHATIESPVVVGNYVAITVTFAEEVAFA